MGIPTHQAPTPPKKDWFSIRRVLAPALAAAKAAPIPAGPAPTTRTSALSKTGHLRDDWEVVLFEGAAQEVRIVAETAAPAANFKKFLRLCEGLTVIVKSLTGFLLTQE